MLFLFGASALLVARALFVARVCVARALARAVVLNGGDCLFSLRRAKEQAQIASRERSLPLMNKGRRVVFALSR